MAIKIFEISPRVFLNRLRHTQQAQGDVIYFDGTNWVRLGAGTSGHFLKTQGAAANPTWAAVSTGIAPQTVGSEYAMWAFNNNFTEVVGITTEALSASGSTFDATTFKLGTHALTSSGGTNAALTANIDSKFTGTALTCAFWFRFGTAGALRFLVNLDEVGGAGAKNWLVYKSAADKIVLDVGGTTKTGTTTLSVNTWYHCIVTKSGTTWKIYINGTQESTDLTATITVDNTEGLNLLGNNRGNPNSGNAWIDDLRFYDYVITSGNITTLYNSGSGTASQITTSTDAAAFTVGATTYYVWVDDLGTVRVNATSIPNLRAGTVVGAQT